MKSLFIFLSIIVISYALVVAQQPTQPQSPQKIVDNFVVQQSQISSQIITLLTQIPGLVSKIDSLEAIVKMKDKELSDLNNKKK